MANANSKVSVPEKPPLTLRKRVIHSLLQLLRWFQQLCALSTRCAMPCLLHVGVIACWY